MDLGLFLQLAGAAMTLIGIFIAGFWRMLAMIRASEDRAALRAEAAQALASATREELHEHKLHTSENFVSKAGMREITDQIMGAIGGLGAQISGMNGRIDRILERPGPTTRRSPTEK